MVAERRERGEEVAAWIEVLDAAEERGVDRHHVLEATVHLARLDHLHLSVLFEDRRADLAGLSVDERRQVALAAQDGGADLPDAAGAQGVRLARPAELGHAPLPALGERARGPRGVR